MSRHLDPEPPAGDRRRLDIALALTCGLAVLAATVGIANAYAPTPRAPHTAALPTALEVREPTGHGGPLAPPTIAADLPVWEPVDGPVLLKGQRPLPQPAAITTAPATPAPEPELVVGTPPLPTTTAAAEPAPVDDGLLPIWLPADDEDLASDAPEVTAPEPTPTGEAPATEPGTNPTAQTTEETVP